MKNIEEIAEYLPLFAEECFDEQENGKIKWKNHQVFSALRLMGFRIIGTGTGLHQRFIRIIDNTIFDVADATEIRQSFIAYLSELMRIKGKSTAKVNTIQNDFFKNSKINIGNKILCSYIEILPPFKENSINEYINSETIRINLNK